MNIAALLLHSVLLKQTAVVGGSKRGTISNVFAAVVSKNKMVKVK